MSYISAKEFLNQSDKVRNELLEWWNPQIGDLCCEYIKYKDIYTNEEKEKYEMTCIFGNKKIEKINNRKNNFIPLLQMHQLIEFIEKKTKGTVNVGNITTFYVTVATNTNSIGHWKIYEFENSTKFKALWEVVIKIIES